MILAAMAVRLLILFFLETYNESLAAFPDLKFAPHHEHFSFGYETGAIAGSIASGHGFSSPFEGSTGATAWIGPIYPYLTAGVFKLFGLYSKNSAIVLLCINSLFGALTCPFIVRIGDKTFGRRTGLAAGWVWAAGIFFTRWATTWVWDMSLTALLLTMAVDCALSLTADGTYESWCKFGLVWGALALSNPAALTVLGVSGLWLLRKFLLQGRSFMRRAAVCALLFIVVISPWATRNRIVFGKWIFLRSNAGFEFSLGNYANSLGLGWFGLHPTQNAREFRKYQEMGEIAYVAAKEHEALSWVKKHPKDFLKLTGKRAFDFWCGTQLDYVQPNIEPWRKWMFWPVSLIAGLGLWLAVREHQPCSVFLTLLILLFPLAYYLTFAQPRYRHYIEPILLLPAMYFLLWPARALRAIRAKESLAKCAAGCEVVAN